MRILSLAAVIALAVLLPASGSAIVIGGSNFQLLRGYPDHTCHKPSKPYKPYEFTKQYEVDLYNAEVDAYNSDLRQFSDCISEYVENVANDIKRIKEKAQAAIDDLESPY